MVCCYCHERIPKGVDKCPNCGRAAKKTGGLGPVRKPLAAVCALLVGFALFAVFLRAPHVFYGNNNATIASGGEICADERHVYYKAVNKAGEPALFSMNEDGTQKKQLCETNGDYLNYAGKWIYFTQAEGSPCIMRTSLEGGKESKVGECTGSWLQISDNKLFFIKTDTARSSGKIYTASLSEKKEQKLCDFRAKCLNVDDDRLFFINESEGNEIWSIKKNGADERKVVAQDCLFFAVDEGKLYFIAADGKRLTYRLGTCSADGADFRWLCDVSTAEFATSKDSVYCLDENFRLIRLPKDDLAHAKQVRREHSMHEEIKISSSGEWLYYRAASGSAADKAMYRIHIYSGYEELVG
ncbi:MAG: DUF5050 domain-containing protein [Oscillospiraceae bacterium]